MYTCFLSAVIKTKICLKSMTLLPKGRRGHTCGENCCVCGGDEVGGGGGGDVFWSDDLSRSGTRSWMKRSPSSAPWFSAGHGGMTACRANKAVSHQPGRHTGSCGVKHLWKPCCPHPACYSTILVPFSCLPLYGQKHTAVCTAHRSVEVHTSFLSLYNAGTWFQWKLQWCYSTDKVLAEKTKQKYTCQVVQTKYMPL